MGRPPCCDKIGIKKGPWTPEEDIILVSYIQEHGPGNWRSVPTNTGLLRCSKSCRLRWTNYLRPGIKRGNFTPHEEGMIIHLQALLGNRWAAIASYLPQRTDNDIKNYWNTHLKKRMKKLQTALDSSLIISNSISSSRSSSQLLQSKSSSSTDMNSTSLSRSSASTYASSTENISRLLEGWMKPSVLPKATNNLNKDDIDQEKDDQQQTIDNNINVVNVGSSASISQFINLPKVEEDVCGVISHEELENFFSFENLSSMSWEKSSTDSTPRGSLSSLNDRLGHMTSSETKERSAVAAPNRPTSAICFSDKWFVDEESGHVEDLMDLSLDNCCSAPIF